MDPGLRRDDGHELDPGFRRDDGHELDLGFRRDDGRELDPGLRRDDGQSWIAAFAGMTDSDTSRATRTITVQSKPAPAHQQSH